MGRTRNKTSRVYWKGGRAYGDFRDFAKWGGGLEGLKAEGEKFATTDADQASILAARRLSALIELQRQHPAGLVLEAADPKERFPHFVAYHLHAIASVDEDDRSAPSATTLASLRGMLTVWAGYLASVGVVRLDHITAQHIRDFLKVLKTRGVPPEMVASQTRKGGRRGPLNRTTRRKYFDALARCLHRAHVERYITANPAAEILEKPTAAPSPNPFMEIGDGALLVEACRRYVAGGNGSIPFLAELVACYLLTGGRGSEVKGLAVADVDFERGVVRFRPNTFRARLKNRSSTRKVPLFPQLREMLTAYLSGPHAPPADGLLFPKPNTGGRVLLGDWRKTLESAAATAGFARGSVRPQVWRITYATARIQTMDNGEPVARRTVQEEMGHTSGAMLDRVYGRLGEDRQRREHVEYRWADYEATHGYRLNGAELAGLTSAQRGTLEAIAAHPAGLSMREWQDAAQRNPGSLFPQRDRLAALGLVEKTGEGRGAKWAATHAARVALRAA